MFTQSSGMVQPDFENELSLLEGLRSRNIKAYAALYKEYSEDLLLLAYTLTNDAPLCQVVVDDLFIDLWEKGMFTDVAPPLHHFLYSELRKRCARL